MKRKPTVAYFCMEYGLDSDFKIYAGGLGILAGDILKTAKDKDLPMVAVGILWRQGYGTQFIDKDGKCCDLYKENRYKFLKDTGVNVYVSIKGQRVKVKVWLCDCFSNVPLYLLDVNLPDNPESLITGQLYGWFPEERVAQEIILGVGGVRALNALKIKVDCYHFNEGHAALAGIELIEKRMASKNASFEQAWEWVKKRIVFTTHTPVKEGNEAHEHGLLRYMGANGSLTYNQMLKIGGDPFNMTIAGLRLSRATNAVSELHACTANKMWEDYLTDYQIIAITNGVHNGTWQDSRIVQAFSKKSDLFKVHQTLKKELVEFVCKKTGVMLNPNALTIGFARRAVPYKRSDLIFSDTDKLEELFGKGLQIIFSGKAHPNDQVGKGIVERLVKFTKKYPKNVIFLPDYDMEIGRMLTRGCDIWLNNPIRPLEASGTSGMKAAMNGTLNLSVLDGWWPEGCEHGTNGWQIGDGYQGEDADKNDAKSLYKILKDQCLPLYYGNRMVWEKMMYSSIEMSSEKFSGEEMMRKYYDLMYDSVERNTRAAGGKKRAKQLEKDGE